MSQDASYFVSGGNMTISTQWTATGGGPVSLELFITFQWSGGSGGTETRTVEYFIPNEEYGGTAATTAGVQRTYIIDMDFPETVTKTLRSAYVETAVVSSDTTSPVNVNSDINSDAITATGTGYVSYTQDGEGISFYTLEDISSSVSVSGTKQFLFFNIILDATASVSPKAIVTYDTVFPTLVKLSYFKAIPGDKKVILEWETKSEINNMGFNLYRSYDPVDGYVRINKSLIPGLGDSVIGRTYTYTDLDVKNGITYYYLLEDVDRDLTTTRHGPVSAIPGALDSDGDGMPDEWEIKYGLNPYKNDANLDPDKDGLTNLEEFNRGTDPNVFDNSIYITPIISSQTEITEQGLKVISSDTGGMLVELITPEFKQEEKIVDGKTFTSISISGYGNTEKVGLPQLPVKGFLLNIPSEANASVNVIDYDVEKVSLNSKVYPVPEPVVKKTSFQYFDYKFKINESFYNTDSFYPENLSEIGFSGFLRDKKVVNLKFFPIQYNPVKNEIKFYKRIRVELKYNYGRGEVGGISSRSSPISFQGEGDTWYKIFVNEDGVYRITYNDLQNVGINLSSLDPQTIKIFNLGSEIPIYISGEEDGVFNVNDYIEFYGTENTSEFSDTNVYWLTYGETNGKRMSEINGSLTGQGNIPQVFLDTAHFEENLQYWDSVPNGNGKDHWFWEYMLDSWGPIDIPISISGVASSSENASLKILVHGFSYDPNVSPDHQINVLLNGNSLGNVKWEGEAEQVFQVSFPQSYLNEGENTITLSTGGTGAEYDASFLNWIEITYYRNFVSENNCLKFSYSNSGLFQFDVKGFTENEIEVFDITEPANPARIINTTISGESPYTVSFENTISSPKTYFVVGYSEIKTPTIVQDTPSDLTSSTNGADYIIITHEDFYNSIQPLVNLRQSKGLRVKVVKVTDIYDEFSYGLFTPYAIKDFLTYAYNNWQPPAPSYVLLVGDANFDYKDYLGTGVINYVPTYLMDTPYLGQTASDNWFVCVSGNDSLPDMSIGRLPVKTPSETETIVNKILEYEKTGDTNSWNKNVLFIADNATEGWETEFEIDSNQLVNILPQSYNPLKDYLSSYTNPAEFSSKIISDMNNGSLIVNYFGHASIDSLAHEDIFNTGSISSLNNAGKYFFFVSMTCITGYFQIPDYECLAEELLRAENKGAVACLAPTGLGVPNGHILLDSALFTSIFKNDIRNLGPAILEAKTNLLANSESWWDLVETFTLFGDPCMELSLPTPRIPKGLTAIPGINAITLTWNANTESDLKGYNIYRGSTTGEYSLLTSVGEVTQYIDEEVSSETTYYYVITAIDTYSNESPYSSEVNATPSAPEIPSSSSGGGGGCFIATCVYGTPMAEEVKILKQFRDRFLMKSVCGRNFVKFYYVISPKIADFIRNKPILKSLVRIYLKPLIYILQHTGKKL